jgi:hypothetical protein
MPRTARELESSYVVKVSSQQTFKHNFIILKETLKRTRDYEGDKVVGVSRRKCLS